ncbi:helix-turn-helix transcriptional regulator [Bradyrhizobium sp. JR4.1]|uniref:helix-turn-helix domain-containing protein n=1 Tax=Bradyrhizobium sp. JR4.1 TaxID=3156372 RepID=UPI0033960484
MAHERSCACGLEAGSAYSAAFRKSNWYDARIDRSYMGRIEQKKENPTIDLLDRIAATLGVHLSELFAEPAKCAMPPKPMSRGRKPARQCRNMK